MKSRSSYLEIPENLFRQLPNTPLETIMNIEETSSLHILFMEPLKGWRLVSARKHRKKEDWSHEVRELLETDYPNARKIILVYDNLNTHTIGALYTAFLPAEVSRLLKSLEIHHTPKTG